MKKNNKVFCYWVNSCGKYTCCHNCLSKNCIYRCTDSLSSCKYKCEIDRAEKLRSQALSKHDVDFNIVEIKKNGYITYSAYSGTEALLFLEKQKVNLIILDLMLPGLSGEQVLAEIKKTKNVPVIGLSAKEDSKSKIFLLKNGADDYVTKPFDIEELLARIETILRRIYENQYTSNSLLCCGDLNLDTIGMEATLKNQKLPLTKNEFAILKMLMEHPQQVFTKDMIYEQLWNETLEGTENAINVHISNLRKKIAAIDNSKSYIKTVWGIGFKMDI